MAVLTRSWEFCLASVCALALTGVAGAADQSFKAPVPVFSWTGVYLGIGGGTGWGNNQYSWNQDATLAAVAAQMPNGGGPLPLVGGTQGSLPISGGFSEANLEETGRSSGPFSESRPTLIGLTSRATAVASMLVQLPPRVSVLPAMTKFRVSAPSRVESVQQLIMR
jgi:hypothetical protein